MPSSRLSFRCDPEMVQRVDEARGFEPRESWLRRAVERALGDAGTQDAKPRPGERPAPAERPGGRVAGESGIPNERATGGTAAPEWQGFPVETDESVPRGEVRAVYRQHVPGPNVENVRASSSVKRDVRPVPKGPQS